IQHGTRRSAILSVEVLEERALMSASPAAASIHLASWSWRVANNTAVVQQPAGRPIIVNEAAATSASQARNSGSVAEMTAGQVAVHEPAAMKSTDQAPADLISAT